MLGQQLDFCCQIQPCSKHIAWIGAVNLTCCPAARRVIYPHPNSFRQVLIPFGPLASSILPCVGFYLLPALSNHPCAGLYSGGGCYKQQSGFFSALMSVVTNRVWDRVGPWEIGFSLTSPEGAGSRHMDCNLLSMRSFVHSPR